jgi:CopG antitoxin of type II toxin-antitoxin system
MCVGNPSPQGGVRQRAGLAPVRLPNLKPATQTISLRLPFALLERIKVEPNKRDMPYQSLINAWLAAAAMRDLRGAVWFLAVEIQSRLRLEF